MNKAFVKEADPDGKAFCPRCTALGQPVLSGPLDTWIRPESRSRLGSSAWFCPYARCDVAYFDLFGTAVSIEELRGAVYPKDPDANLCACFGFTQGEVEADASEPQPVRIRGLLARARSPEARCATLAPNGECCLREIQRLYWKARGGQP